MLFFVVYHWQTYFCSLWIWKNYTLIFSWKSYSKTENQISLKECRAIWLKIYRLFAQTVFENYKTLLYYVSHLEKSQKVLFSIWSHLQKNHSQLLISTYLTNIVQIENTFWDLAAFITIESKRTFGSIYYKALTNGTFPGRISLTWTSSRTSPSWNVKNRKKSK